MNDQATEKAKTQKYRTVSVHTDILKAVGKIVDDKKYLYRSVSDFVNSTLRDKINELQSK